jgi:isopentenyl diphosphate isomerase/L-lactate dehydrogenase-like FMN-dependent dehydrogenase
MKIFVKGIMSAEDAVLCVKNGMDGVYISNHGGRAEDTGASTISVLQDVVAAVNKKIPIFIDGGFRRGMDIVKALAMGATAVGVGRPYIWGLGAFGEPGVAKVLDILITEVQVAMQQVGAVSLNDLKPEMIHRAL